MKNIILNMAEYIAIEHCQNLQKHIANGGNVDGEIETVCEIYFNTMNDMSVGRDTANNYADQLHKFLVGLNEFCLKNDLDFTKCSVNPDPFDENYDIQPKFELVEV